MMSSTKASQIYQHCYNRSVVRIKQRIAPQNSEPDTHVDLAHVLGIVRIRCDVYALMKFHWSSIPNQR